MIRKCQSITSPIEHKENGLSYRPLLRQDTNFVVAVCHNVTWKRHICYSSSKDTPPGSVSMEKAVFAPRKKTAFLPNVLLKMRWVFQSDEEITEMIFTSNSIPSKALVLFSFNSRVKRAILTRFSYHLCNSSTPKRGDRGKQDKV